MKYFTILLPLLCTILPSSCFEHDGITISIELGTSEANTTINYKGEDIKILADLDITAFNLSKNNLENAVKEYSGEKATDIFINSPTPWNDLYKTYNWREVKREFKIKDFQLINVTKDEINLTVKEYTNNDTTVKDINGSVVGSYHTFFSTHYWHGSNVAAKIKYEITTRLYSPSLHYAYISKVGENEFESGLSNIVTNGEARARFSLEPGQTARLYLKANEVTVWFKVEYETKLTGDVVVNYANKHLGHHFWSYDINKVMSAVNMTTALKSDEYVKVVYLVEEGYKTNVVDAKTGEDINFIPF